MRKVFIDNENIPCEDIKENVYYIDKINGYPGEVLKSTIINGDMVFAIVLCDDPKHIGATFPLFDYAGYLITLTGKELHDVLKRLTFQ